jgi:hypothetical protein
MGSIPMGIPPQDSPDFRGQQAQAQEQAQQQERYLAELRKGFYKVAASNNALQGKAKILAQQAQRAMELASGWTTGPWASFLANFPTQANELAGIIGTIKARSAFQELQEMRDNSPTGGALGQVTDSEREALGSATATLDQRSAPDVLRRNLGLVADSVERMAQNAQIWFGQSYAPLQPGGAMPGTVPLPQGAPVADRFGPQAQQPQPMAPGAQGQGMPQQGGLTPEEQAELERYRAQFGSR